LQTSDCKWATALSIFSYNCVLFQLLSGTRGERGPCFPCSFKRGRR